MPIIHINHRAPHPHTDPAIIKLQLGTSHPQTQPSLSYNLDPAITGPSHHFRCARHVAIARAAPLLVRPGALVSTIAKIPQMPIIVQYYGRNIAAECAHNIDYGHILALFPQCWPRTAPPRCSALDGRAPETEPQFLHFGRRGNAPKTPIPPTSFPNGRAPSIHAPPSRLTFAAYHLRSAVRAVALPRRRWRALTSLQTLAWRAIVGSACNSCTWRGVSSWRHWPRCRSAWGCWEMASGASRPRSGKNRAFARFCITPSILNAKFLQNFSLTI